MIWNISPYKAALHVLEKNMELTCQVGQILAIQVPVAESS